MKNFILAAVVALMAAPVFASDQEPVRTESDKFIVEPILRTDVNPADEAAVDDSTVPEGIQAQGLFYRRGWACLWNTGGAYYYTRSYARSYAYYGGYNACGYQTSCVCTGCYQSGWWVWNGVAWTLWN